MTVVPLQPFHTYSTTMSACTRAEATIAGFLDCAQRVQEKYGDIPDSSRDFAP